MKKLVTTLLLFAVAAISAQESYWANYSIIVEPHKEATVYKLIDDYFKAHKYEGVTVTLYANHFHDADNNSTHTLGFSGSLDAMGAVYADDGGDAWALLASRLDDHIKEWSANRMGTTKRTYGDTSGNYPVQRYFILDVENATAFEAAYSKFQNAHPLNSRVVMMGNFTSGISPEGENHWVLSGYADFKAAMGGTDVMLTPAQKKARDADWKNFEENNGGVRMIRSGTRVRIGQW